MINLIFNNLTAAGVATLMAAYQASDDYDDTQNPSISMSAREYLRMLDNPATGATLAPSAAAVFSAGASMGEPDVHIPPVSAAAAFGNANLVQEPIISMTEKADGMTLQSFYDNGWNNDQLVEHGYIVITAPAPVVYGGDGGPNGQPVIGTPKPPAPPSAPAAPASAPQSTGAPAGAVQLDATGIPWDARIHASTRTVNKDGTFKKMKGVDATLFESISAELRAAHTKPFTPLNAGANATGAAPPPPGAQNTATASAAPPPPSSATAAPPPPNAAAAAPSVPTTFADFCKFVTGQNFKSGVVTEVCEKYGIPGLGRLAESSNHFLFEPMYHEFLALRK